MEEKPAKVPYETFEIQEPPSKPMTHQEFQMFKAKQNQKDDQLLDELHNQAKRIKEGQLLIKNTLKSQEPLLEQIDNDMDRVGTKMEKSNNVLEKYLEKSSDSCLYWTIGIELVILFLFFML